jgi:hypothetical protein
MTPIDKLKAKTAEEAVQEIIDRFKAEPSEEIAGAMAMIGSTRTTDREKYEGALALYTRGFTAGIQMLAETITESQEGTTAP